MSTEKSLLTATVFDKWLRDVFLRAVDEKRRALRELLGDFDDRALLILDGCSSHLGARFQRLLEAHRVTMRFLVPHTSHLTQPLDVGIFGRVKYLIRTNSSYVVNLHNIDRAVADEVAARNGRRRPSAEPGKKLADFILTILQAFHQATTPPRVVSAFEQVGLCSRFADNVGLIRRVAFVDPTRARLVIEETDLFRNTAPVPDARHRQINIADLNSQNQNEMAPRERQRPARRAARRAPRPTPDGLVISLSPTAPAPRGSPSDLPVDFSAALRAAQRLPFSAAFLTQRTPEWFWSSNIAAKPPRFRPSPAR